MGKLFDTIKPLLSKAKSWVRNEDTNKAILQAIADLKTNLNDKIDDNERSRLRSEIVKYYYICLRGGVIHPDEMIYLRDEVMAKYEKLQGNGQAHHMYSYIVKYYEQQEENKQ